MARGGTGRVAEMKGMGGPLVDCILTGDCYLLTPLRASEWSSAVRWLTGRGPDDGPGPGVDWPAGGDLG